LAALTPTEISREANLREARVEALLKKLESSGDVLAVSRPSAFVGAGHAEKLLQAVLRFLEEAQTREPWAMGATSVTIARALDVPEALLVRILNAMAEEGRLARRAGFFSTTDF